MALLGGCQMRTRSLQPDYSPPPGPTIGQYHMPGFSWANVGRVLVLPVHNESQYTRAGVEVRGALSAELQRQGRFEVVTPPPDHPACYADFIHTHGHFDEGAMMALGREFAADVVVHVSVTHYSPYQHPRLGLVIQAVSPFDGKVVASVDGLWDTVDPAVAQQLRNYYHAAEPGGRFAAFRAPPLPADDGHDEELALQSPALFQRYVSCQAVRLLTRAP